MVGGTLLCLLREEVCRNHDVMSVLGTPDEVSVERKGAFLNEAGVILEFEADDIELLDTVQAQEQRGSIFRQKVMLVLLLEDIDDDRCVGQLVEWPVEPRENLAESAIDGLMAHDHNDTLANTRDEDDVVVAVNAEALDRGGDGHGGASLKTVNS